MLFIPHYGRLRNKDHLVRITPPATVLLPPLAPFFWSSLIYPPLVLSPLCSTFTMPLLFVREGNRKITKMQRQELTATGHLVILVRLCDEHLLTLAGVFISFEKWGCPFSNKGSASSNSFFMVTQLLCAIAKIHRPVSVSLTACLCWKFLPGRLWVFWLSN